MFDVKQLSTLTLALFVGGCSFQDLGVPNPFAEPADRPTSVASPNPPLASPTASPSPGLAFRFSQGGKGLLLMGEQPDQALTTALVEGQDRQATITFQDNQGQTVRLSGDLVSRTPEAMTINLTSFGQAEASGTVRVQYGENQAIDQIAGNGVLDGKAFAVEFNAPRAQAPSPSSSPAPAPLSSPVPPPATPVPTLSPPVNRPDINLSEQGGGLFQLAGRDDRTLSSASVIGLSDGMVDLAFRFMDGGQVRFGGKVDRMDAYTISIRLMNSGNADADGSVTVEYGANSSINTVFGEGTLDSQPFAVQFRGGEQAQSPPTAPTVERICYGGINGWNYSANYSGEQGFSAIQFRDRGDRVVAETGLTYSERNSQGQAIYRGSLNDGTEVILIDLSAEGAGLGSEISVGLNQEWSRGICQ
ncbi:MAG: hypothetical protein Kow00121_22080 [Elainellaceae cyanobacterium]